MPLERAYSVVEWEEAEWDNKNRKPLLVLDKIATMEEVVQEIPTKCHKEVAMKSHTIVRVLDQISLLPLSFRMNQEAIL